MCHNFFRNINDYSPSLMYSYQARISVISPILPSLTFTLNTSCCTWNFSFDLNASEPSAPLVPTGMAFWLVRDLSI